MVGRGLVAKDSADGSEFFWPRGSSRRITAMHTVRVVSGYR